MNNEIKKTERGFEVEYTDRSNELYAEEQVLTKEQIESAKAIQKIYRECMGLGLGSIKDIAMLLGSTKDEDIYRAAVNLITNTVKESKINEDLAQIKVEKKSDTPYLDSLVDGSAFKFAPRYNEDTKTWIQAPTGGWLEPISAIYKHMKQENPVYPDSEFRPSVDVYNKLEDIVTDMTEAINIPNTTLKVVYMQECRDKLQRTISSGKYLQKGEL